MIQIVHIYTVSLEILILFVYMCLVLFSFFCLLFPTRLSEFLFSPLAILSDRSRLCTVA